MTDGQDPQEVSRLIREAQNGATDAFGQIYELFAPRVFRFLYAHTGDRMDAEDMTEEVFMKVWQYLPAYQDRGAPFGGFLFRVARNVLIDHYRKNGRQIAEANHAEFEEHHDTAQPDPADSLSVQTHNGLLRSRLAELSDDHRTVLELRFLAGLSSEETARAMDKSPGAVRVLQHRALLALRKLLESR